MRKKSILNYLFIAVIMTLASCSKNTEYAKVYDLKNDTWSQSNLLDFSFEVKDTTKSYDITFFMRVSQDYDYNNAWITLHSTLPDNKTYKESHEFRMSDDKGNWLGKKSGSLVECEMIFKNRKFPEIGNYKFVLEQATTKEELSQVNSVGMTLSEVKKK